MKFSTLVRGRAIAKRRNLRNRLRPTCATIKVADHYIDHVGLCTALGASLASGLYLIRGEQLARRTMAHTSSQRHNFDDYLTLNQHGGISQD